MCDAGRVRAAAILIVVVAGGCVSTRPPHEQLALAQEEIDAGRTRPGVVRMEHAFVALGVDEPERWDRLGEIAAAVDPDVASRAFARAEALLWPDPGVRSRTRLSLPFSGPWRVTQGNRGEFSHRRLADRFAWDFQRVDATGSAGGDGPLASFVGFGAVVRAPADGVVVRAEDGVPDNEDGARNHVRAGGNVVVLRHRGDEHSHFCHLQRGSLLVSVGDEVRRGQPLARCGSSGNAIEPHLHFVLRTGPTSEDPSIPVVFDDAPGDGVPDEGEIVVGR